MLKLLFVCSQNRLRSPTAEAVFSAYPGVEAISAGTNHDAITPVSTDLIEWADVVIVMETVHRIKLTTKFKSAFKNKKLVVLDIPDNYEYMDPELIKILKAKVPRYIRLGMVGVGLPRYQVDGGIGNGCEGIMEFVSGIPYIRKISTSLYWP